MPSITSASWMRIAKGEIGVKEIPGPEDNPRIEEYLATTDYPVPEDYSDEVPSCSAFVNWVLKKDGIKGTNSAWSQSWKNWGKKLESPRYGAIIVFYWGNGRGHTGFVWDYDEDGVWVLGSNQHDSVNITYFSYKNVVAYRMPKKDI